jgi:hypothetical protein
MKKVAVVLLVLVGLVVAVVVAVFFMTGGIVDTADQFFTAVAAEDHALARTHLAAAFLAETSDDQLTAWFSRLRELGYQGASWHTRNIANDQGLLEGSLETGDGGTVPITITLVKESGEWKILAIEQPAAGLLGGDASREIPPRDVMERLVDGSIQELAGAINADDFTAFHASSARLWQAQTTPAALREAFAAFVEQGIDLTVLADLEPVFSQEPRIEDDGALYLVGYYPSQPSVTHFELTYVYEHPEWKLLGAGVEIK